MPTSFLKKVFSWLNYLLCVSTHGTGTQNDLMINKTRSGDYSTGGGAGFKRLIDVSNLHSIPSLLVNYLIGAYFLTMVKIVEPYASTQSHSGII